MKKRLLSLLGSLVFISLCFAQSVSAQSSEFISEFNSEVTLEENTDILIKEEIHYFFPDPKHGIIREIPVDYKVGGGFKRPTTLSLKEIYYYEESSPENTYSAYERSSKNGYAIFKIGDAETTIEGSYVYVIEYTLKNAVNFFDDHDELYLNITGNGWEVPIKSASAKLSLPGEITDSVCFTGATESTESNCLAEVEGQEATVTTTEELDVYNGLTIAFKMPKGTLEDTTRKQFFAFLVSNIGILLPIPVFFLVYSKYKKKGTNKKITIIPHYKPNKDLDPLLGGFLYEKKLSNKIITSQIIQMAIDGFASIEQEGKRKFFLKKSDTKNKPSETYQLLLDGIFKKKDRLNIKKIPTDFYKTVSKLQKTSLDSMYSKEYFDRKKKSLKNTFLILGVVAFILGITLTAPLSFIAALGWALGIIMSGVILFIFSFLVDLRSIEGNKLYYELKGLRMYIDTAEKHRIEFHNDPDKFRGVFETLLPYAIIFGLEKKWAKEFKDIYKEPPNWYRGDFDHFNSYLLINSLSSINKGVKSKSTPPNSAGGFASTHGASGGSGFSGGSSGGGFGGGGGGSW